MGTAKGGVGLALVWSAALGLACALAPPQARAAPAQPALELSGAIPRPGPLTLEEVKAAGRVEAKWESHGEVHQVAGARLDKLLAARGWEPGRKGKDVPKEEKRAGLRKVVLATAADGFQSVLSCAEVAEEVGATAALVVWELDGKPLTEGKGPLRLVVLTDKEPSRSIFALRSLQLLDVAPAKAAK
jgi:DMSO/TMAO reductase YedYZ molybdopterin-dependent catalytic subunit